MYYISTLKMKIKTLAQKHYQTGPKGLFDIVSEFVFFENKNENENGVLQLLYFEFKYAYGIILCILCFKTENNNMRSVDTVENDKNIEYAFGSTFFQKQFLLSIYVIFVVRK